MGNDPHNVIGTGTDNIRRYRVIIVDDEPLARQRMQQLLEAVEGWTCIGQAGNAQAAHQLIISLRPDAVLLDINMPGDTGLSLAENLGANLGKQAPAIIFTTAHEEHALAAFDCHASDYLLKPVRRQRLQQALEKAATQLPTRIDNRFITVRNSQQIEKIGLATISCCIADDKYVRLVHDDGEALCDDSLASLEQVFDDYFVRVHRNALVARTRILGLSRVSGQQWQVRLNGCELQPEISRRHLESLRKLLFD